MPIIHSAIKKLRRDRRAASRNIHLEETLKRAVKNARRKPTQKSLSAAFKALDKAAKTNYIHKNKAGRVKARLSKLLKK